MCSVTNKLHFLTDKIRDFHQKLISLSNIEHVSDGSGNYPQKSRRLRLNSLGQKRIKANFCNKVASNGAIRINFEALKQLRGFLCVQRNQF